MRVRKKMVLVISSPASAINENEGKKKEMLLQYLYHSWIIESCIFSGVNGVTIRIDRSSPVMKKFSLLHKIVRDIHTFLI